MNNRSDKLTEHIEGSVENIIFRNEESGYTVFIISHSHLNSDDSQNKITCTACFSDINLGENLRLIGNFVIHPSYGRQFNALSAERLMPATIDGIQKYLGSGAIKGVGEKLAERIVGVFRDKTLDVIENFPEKLAQVRGISMKKAVDIGEVFKTQTSLRNIMIHLQSYGITPNVIQKIYKHYKEDSLEIVKRNPYILAEDIIGIGFKTADTIAFRVGIEPTSEFRIKAGVKYTLQQGAQNGHVYLERNILIENSSQILLVPKELIENALVSLQLERQIVQENQNDEVAVYLNKYFYAENYCARKLLELSNNVRDNIDDIDSEITALEIKNDITLAKEQRSAVKEALKSGVLVVTGGPGTGKTTVINVIISLFKNRKLEIELAAPTGKAAKRMEEATGMDAKTIHRLLGMNANDESQIASRFEKDEDNPLETDVIILDETSMIDIMLMYSFLKAVPYGAQLVLVGDADQLPSVGPGNVLNDIIKCGEIKVIKLNEVFRQSQESAIVMNAHRINNGVRPVLNEKERDFFFVKRINADDLTRTLTELVKDRLPAYSGADPLTEIQILTPMRKSILGSVNLNKMLQLTLNPPSPQKKEKEMNDFIFREGDKVMQIKNNYNVSWRVYDREYKAIFDGTGIYNGDEGIIEIIDNDSETIQVRFEGGRVVSYDFSRLDELELSYAVTIHKSQGSEYKVVVMPIHSGPPQLMTRNLLYTAITRAKELVVIVGVPEALYRMVDNNKELKRFSALNYRIKKIKGFIRGDQN